MADLTDSVKIRQVPMHPTMGRHENHMIIRIRGVESRVHRHIDTILIGRGRG